MHVRVCPNCGEEYRPEIVRCADCGELLQDHHDEPADPSPIEAAGRPGLDLRSDLVRLASAERAVDLDGIAKRLGASRIPYLVRTSFQAFSLFIGPEDAERALDAVRDLLPGEPSPGGEELASDERPASCPACGAELHPGGSACPDCGLGLGEVDPAEPEQ